MGRSAFVKFLFALSFIAACGDDEEELASTMGTTPTEGSDSETGDSATSDAATDAGDPTSDTEASETNGAPSDQWWFEIDVLDFDRGEGSVALIIGRQIEANSGGDNGRFTLTTSEPVPREPGSYPAFSILGFHDEMEPRRGCVGVDGDPTITLEVISGDPFEATFSGMVECWEGDELYPDGPDGETLPSTLGNVNGYIYQR